MNRIKEKNYIWERIPLMGISSGFAKPSGTPAEPWASFIQSLTAICLLISVFVFSNIILMVVPNSPLAKILTQAKTMNTPERAELLENSDELEAAHTSFSQQGQSRAPSAEEETETHYVALVKHVNPTTGKTMIYELDGRRLGPVERVELPQGEDLLGETALGIVKEFMQREMESGRQAFSLCALAPSLD
jgi:ubiquitin carboxyl-terminal hydrolase L3